jgi:hypothetical protein
MLKDLQPLSRVARVAPLVESITAARGRGVTWRQIVTEIGTAVGIDPSTPGAPDTLRIAHRAAVRQLAKGRLVPQQTQVSAPSAPPAAQPKPAPFGQSDGEQRPTRPGWTTIPLDKPLNK